METLRYVVLVNGLLAVVSLAYYVLLRRETFFGANRLALWLGLLSAFVLPLLELPDWRPQPVRTVMQRTAQAIVPKVFPNVTTPKPDITITYPNGKTFPAFQQPLPTNTWSWPYVLIGLYALGVFLLSCRFFWQLSSLRKLIQQSVHEPYDGFTLVCNETITSPFSFFNWVVLNPDRHTPDELEQILRHERIHVRERHSFDMIGAEWLCILFWFNPAAYLFRHLIHQTLEFSADRAVLAEGVDVKLYQYNLLKVSLSAGQSAITNHFSKSQLTSRIIMLNKPGSLKITWLKYPVFFIVTLTVASAFARPKAHMLAKFMPRPAAQTLATIISTEPTKPQFTTSIGLQQPVPLSAQMSVRRVALPADSVQKSTTSHDTVRVSPSRYMEYEGDKLYWIITPKTSFDDLAIMKQEFERHGYKMQVQTLKYDPLNTFISDIKITITRPIVGISDFEETGMNGGPIRSHGGYNGLNTLKTVAAVGSYPFNNEFLHIPQKLVQIARDEQLSTTKLTQDQKMENLVRDGIQKYGHLGIGPRRFYKKEILEIQQSTTGGYLTVNPDSSLSVDETADYAKLFINNKLVTPKAIRGVKIDQLYVLAVIYGYPSAQQEEQKKPGTRYLLFYINEDK